MKVCFNTTVVLDVPDEMLLKALAGNGVALKSVAEVTDADLDAVLVIEDFGSLVLDKPLPGVTVDACQSQMVYMEPRATSPVQRMVDAERVRRAEEETRAFTIEREYHDTVLDLHAAIQPYLEEISDLVLLGDYNAKVRQGDVQTEPVQQEWGVLIRLARNAVLSNPQVLALQVVRRSDVAAARIVLRNCKLNDLHQVPYGPQTPANQRAADWPADQSTAAVEQLLRELVKALA